MTITTDAQAGKIINVPLNGTPQQISEIPEGFTPHYSGAVLILTGDQTEGDKNLNILNEFGIKVIGDAVVLSQDTWHDIN